eukprot:gene6424-9317_t
MNKHHSDEEEEEEETSSGETKGPKLLWREQKKKFQHSEKMLSEAKYRQRHSEIVSTNRRHLSNGESLKSNSSKSRHSIGNSKHAHNKGVNSFDEDDDILIDRLFETKSRKTRGADSTDRESHHDDDDDEEEDKEEKSSDEQKHTISTPALGSQHDESDSTDVDNSPKGLVEVVDSDNSTPKRRSARLQRSKNVHQQCNESGIETSKTRQESPKNRVRRSSRGTKRSKYKSLSRPPGSSVSSRSSSSDSEFSQQQQRKGSTMRRANAKRKALDDLVKSEGDTSDDTTTSQESNDTDASRYIIPPRRSGLRPRIVTRAQYQRVMQNLVDVDEKGVTNDAVMNRNSRSRSVSRHQSQQRNSSNEEDNQNPPAHFPRNAVPTRRSSRRIAEKMKHNRELQRKLRESGENGVQKRQQRQQRRRPRNNQRSQQRQSREYRYTYSSLGDDKYRSAQHVRGRSSRKLHSRWHRGFDSTIEVDFSSEDEYFEHRKARSIARARLQMRPLNDVTCETGDSNVVENRRKVLGHSGTIFNPMTIDTSVSFSDVGGLEHHIEALKEMIVFPLLYPELFDRFKMDPPRGVLFYGPPGTGKTLCARALANECSRAGRHVHFFMRKGADCLSKWVGESERTMRLLFNEAYLMRPSIIFFDEIDGLAPTRANKQDHHYNSIVSTLLALMDGLDKRSDIVVIGATNRPESLDPALRRPGRFDRELYFPLPSYDARKAILSIQTKAWSPSLSESFLSVLAEECAGFCGADIRALCTEAVLAALRRTFPQ